jgi:hypothetical protein
MTRQTFYRNLRKLLPKKIIFYNSGSTNGPIWVKDNFDDVFCPITYLCKLKTGRIFDKYDWVDAAKLLELPKQEADIIVAAADNYFEGIPSSKIDTVMAVRQTLKKIFKFEVNL